VSRDLDKPNSSGKRVHALLVLGVTAATLVYDPLASAAQPKRFVALLLSVAAIAWVLGAWARQPRNSRKLSLGVSAGAWMLFVAWSMTSILWGKPVGLDVAMAWMAGAGIVLATGVLSANRVQTTALHSGWWIGTVSSVAVIAQWLSGVRGIALHGTQGNGNWLGLLLAITLPLSAGFVATGRSKGAWWWVAGLVGAILQLPALVLAGSRVAWVAAAAACATAMLVALSRRARLSRGIAAFMLVGAVASLSTESLARSAGPEAELIGAEAKESLGGRTWIWRTSMHAARSALPFGTGLGGFGHAYLEAQGQALRQMPVPDASRQFHNATTAHQDWIQALVETGPVGLALLVTCVAAAMVGHLRKRSWAAAGALVAFIACACGDSPLRQPAIVVLVCLLFASAPRRRWPWPTSTLSVGLVVTSLSMAAALAGWMATRWETEAGNALLDTRIALLQRAIRLDGRSGQAELSLGLAKLELAEPKGAIPLLERSRDRLANVGTDIALGNAWLESGDAARAERSYRRALAMHPGSFRGHANLAEALQEQGKLDEAGRQLALAKRLYPGHPKLPEMEERLRRALRDRDLSESLP